MRGQGPGKEEALPTFTHIATETLDWIRQHFMFHLLLLSDLFGVSLNNKQTNKQTINQLHSSLIWPVTQLTQTLA